MAGFFIFSRENPSGIEGIKKAGWLMTPLFHPSNDDPT